MPRVALVHDFLLDLRGAERVFAAICDAWPEADVFTAVYDETGTEGRFAARSPQASFLQRLRPTSRTFRPLLPLYPHAVESLDLRGYDVVVSSSSAWAHGVLVDPGAVHVCYCHNPFRYAWSEREATLDGAQPADPRRRCACCSRAGASGTGSRPSASTPTSRTRRSPRRGSGATSGARRRSCTRRWSSRASHPGPVGAHYLVLAELMAHKRIDVAIRAFNALGRPLVVVGDGPEWRRLRRLAGPTVRLTGRLSDGEVADLLRTAQALVVTAEEEFGIAAVESLASGRPVIALRSGGVLETVTAGRTGAFYDDGDDPRALAAAVAGVRSGRGGPGGLCDIGTALRRRALPGAAARDRRRSGRARRCARGLRSVRPGVYCPADRHDEARNP